MDAFALAISYGIKKLSKKQIIFTAISVGIFHFFMPLLGSFVGISLFEHTLFKPRYVVFFIFLLISISMFFDFFEDSKELKTLNLLGIIIFSFSLSILLLITVPGVTIWTTSRFTIPFTAAGSSVCSQMATL